jgi:hypothetical protein
MTYPPQPGQPYGPPDPYGQGGGYPQSGGFPQQPYQGQQQYPPMYPPQPQYPGQGQYPPPPQQPFPGFGGPPEKPKKRRTGLWAGIAVVIVLLIAFGVTGFLAPGFLLGKAAQNSDATAQQLADALGKRDITALNSLRCATTGENVGKAIDEISKVKAATLVGPPTRVSDTETSAVINVTTAAPPAPYTVTFANQDGKWCWKDIAQGAKTGTPS